MEFFGQSGENMANFLGKIWGFFGEIFCGQKPPDVRNVDFRLSLFSL